MQIFLFLCTLKAQSNLNSIRNAFLLFFAVLPFASAIEGPLQRRRERGVISMALCASVAQGRGEETLLVFAGRDFNLPQSGGGVAAAVEA